MRTICLGQTGPKINVSYCFAFIYDEIFNAQVDMYASFGSVLSRTPIELTRTAELTSLTQWCLIVYCLGTVWLTVSFFLFSFLAIIFYLVSSILSLSLASVITNVAFIFQIYLHSDLRCQRQSKRLEDRVRRTQRYDSCRGRGRSVSVRCQWQPTHGGREV